MEKAGFELQELGIGQAEEKGGGGGCVGMVVRVERRQERGMDQQR